MKKHYPITLNGVQIGYSELEYADPPMGIVFGRIWFKESYSPYKNLKEYCFKEDLIIEDVPHEKLLRTSIIPALKIFMHKNVEIISEGAWIEGSEEEGFDIQISGISDSFLKEEFPHHHTQYYGGK